MANEPQYRDLSGNPYLKHFDEKTVERIDKFAIVVAGALFFFGIFYFSFAPAAFLERLEVSTKEIPGFSCRMISAITRSFDPFSRSDRQEVGLVSSVAFSSFKAAVKPLGNSGIYFGSEPPLPPSRSPPTPPSPPPPGFLPSTPEPVMPADSELLTSDRDITMMLRLQSIIMENLLFDTHRDCLQSTTTRYPVCEWSSGSFPATKDSSFFFEGQVVDRAHPLCVFKPSCSTFNGKAKFGPSFSEMPVAATVVNFSAISDPSIGRCSNQFNKSNCSSGIEHCESIQSYQKLFQSAIQNYILTPDVLCDPFLSNPPYLCTRRDPQTVPSILSQSAALASSALAFFKLAMFLIVKKNFFRKPKTEQTTELASVVSNETRITEGGSDASHELL